MRLESDFVVPAPPVDAFELLVDLEAVAGCIPGSEVGAEGPDGSHPARLVVKLGPMRMSYEGKVSLDERDDAARRARVSVSMRERRGQGTVSGSLAMTVEGDPAGSRVSTTTDVQLGGRAAQLGRGVVEDVADRMLADMAECLATRASAAPAASAEPAGAGSAAPAAGRGSAPPEAARPAAPPHPARPVNGLRLLARALFARLRRALRRSSPTRAGR